MEFLWRIFPLLRANRLYAIFNTGLKNLGPSCPRYFFVFFIQSTGFGSVCHEPCPITNFLIFYFRWRGGVPTSFLGSQPIVWLLPSSFRCQTTRVRLPSTNICWSPLCDLHSFLTVTLWWLATVNSNTGNSINLISIVSVGHHVTICTVFAELSRKECTLIAGSWFFQMEEERNWFCLLPKDYFYRRGNAIAIPKTNFITALFLLDIQYFHHRKMICNG